MEKITFKISPLPFTFDIDPESIRSMEKYLTSIDNHLIEHEILKSISRRIPICYKAFNAHKEIKADMILGCIFITMPKGISLYSTSIIRLPVILHLLKTKETSAAIPVVFTSNTGYKLATLEVTQDQFQDSRSASKLLIENIKDQYNKIYTKHLIEYFENNPKAHCIRENGIREYTSPCGAVVRKVGDKCYVSKEHLYKTRQM